MFTYQPFHLLSCSWILGPFTFCREKRYLQRSRQVTGVTCSLLRLLCGCRLAVTWSRAGQTTLVPFFLSPPHTLIIQEQAAVPLFNILQPGCRQQCISQPWTNLRLDCGGNALVWTSWNNAISVWGLRSCGLTSVDLFWVNYILQNTPQGEPLFCASIQGVLAASQLSTLQLPSLEDGLASSDQHGLACSWGSLPGFFLASSSYYLSY